MTTEKSAPKGNPAADGDGGGGDDLGFELPAPATFTPARALLVLVLAAVITGGAFAAGWLPKRHARAALEAEAATSQTALLRVAVVHPKASKSDRSISLPGSVQPLEETVLYPRASGYVRSWAFDLGDHVKEGDVLAEIDTPELDQEMVQAKAQLAQSEAGVMQAQANAVFSQQNLERYKRLAPAGLASEQDLQQKSAQANVDEANIRVARANADAQRANIQRLVRLKSFAHVVAPFAGRVTLRSVERGALVTAGNTSPLFKISNTETVRVYVQIPQDLASAVRIDVPAQVSIREFGGRSFEGKVARSSGALDAITRTMTTEVRVPNAKNELLSGMYAQVALSLSVPHTVYAIPGTALIDDAKGLRVATVTPEGAVHFVPVTVERDTGKEIEIGSGLDDTTRIVKLPNVDIVEGRAIEVVAQ